MDRTTAYAILSDGPLWVLSDAEARRIELVGALDSLEPAGQIHSDPMHIQSLAFSPDRRTLASHGPDRLINLWDRATGENVLSLDTSRGLGGWSRFSPDGKMLATGRGGGPNEPGEITLWYAAPDDVVAAGEADSTGSK
jgi:WD40 repeat protein